MRARLEWGLLALLVAGCGGTNASPTPPTSPPAAAAPQTSGRQRVLNALDAYRAARQAAYNQGYDDSQVASTAGGVAYDAIECSRSGRADSLEATHTYLTYQPISSVLQSVRVNGHSATVVRAEHQIISLHHADGTVSNNDDTYTATYDLRDDGSGWKVVDYTWVAPDGSTGGAVDDDKPCAEPATSAPSATPTPTPMPEDTPTPTPQADTPTPEPNAPVTREYDVAAYREQGVDLLVIPMQSGFGDLSQSDENLGRDALQICASKAGLSGTVVPVWESGLGFYFLAPARWKDYFSSIDMSYVEQRVNEKLTCTF